MVDATQLQDRSRRAVAATVAAILLAVGWLGAHHEADVAHARDGAGHVVHAQELAEHHEADAAAHLHGRDEHQHGPGACALLAASHARTAGAGCPPGIADASIAPLTLPAIAAVTPAIAAYRLAPKTSPPVRA